jgi:hypothetical protein
MKALDGSAHGSEEIKCSRCGSGGFVGGPTQERRHQFLEKSGWRRVNSAWVCNFCTGIGIPGTPYEGPDQVGYGDEIGPMGDM